jgi:hypothetical protein
MSSVLNQIATAENELVKLLGEFERSFVGDVYGMRFDEVVLLTNDARKHGVNGIPHNSFLVAAGFNPKRFADAAPIDQEVVLLRVLEPVSLPQDNDFVKNPA